MGSPLMGEKLKAIPRPFRAPNLIFNPFPGAPPLRGVTPGYPCCGPVGPTCASSRRQRLTGSRTVPGKPCTACESKKIESSRDGVESNRKKRRLPTQTSEEPFCFIVKVCKKGKRRGEPPANGRLAKQRWNPPNWRHGKLGKALS